MIFNENIENWDDWEKVYQSIEAFTPLAKEIFRQNGLNFEPLQKLTPGTNGVFRIGEYVVKIFFPKESGLDPIPDYENECAVCRQLSQWNIPTPSLISHGIIHDKYDFFYIITKYFPGKEAGFYLSSASQQDMVQFVKQLKQILDKFNRPVENIIKQVDLMKRAITNFRLKYLCPKLHEEICARVRNLDLSHLVLVHGDITGENLLVDNDGKLMVIDCADACLAPSWYELAPIVFELFRCRSELLKLFVNELNETNDEFVEHVLDAVCLHDFGAHMLRDAPLREGLTPFEKLIDVKNFLMEKLK